ncbi:MAG: carbonic anhydrase family protein, partial [Gammaproteobacteria bacterium]|nr:carbonic anhydrase family protein [Gammaproteobacteria bacterium]
MGNSSHAMKGAVMTAVALFCLASGANAAEPTGAGMQASAVQMGSALAPLGMARREPAAGEAHSSWGYGGASAPAAWEHLAAEYATCGQGRSQSPVDLRDGIDARLPTLRKSYQPSSLKVVNNGHTIQVEVEPGSTIQMRDETFELLQYHFHHPSEHSVNGALHVMEMHLVHRNQRGELAVVGVMLQVGKPNKALEPVFANMPADAGAERLVADVKINPQDLLPRSEALYHYFGSLTTPPCTEGV